VKEIQICSNKVPSPLQRGDNHRNVKMVWGDSKILFEARKAEYYMEAF
jgi:hypothetical protein